MSNENLIKKEAKRIRELFRLAGELKIAMNATDDEIKILYDMQNEVVKLYNQYIDCDQRMAAFKKRILKRVPFYK